MRYAICGALLCVAIAGAYYSGYAVGSRNVRIEYITKEKEVVKYVSKRNEKIYLRPNDSFVYIYKRMREQK